MKTFHLDVRVFEDGVLGAKVRTDLSTGDYRAVLIVDDGAPERRADGEDDLLPLADHVERARREHIARALARCDGNRSHAARLLKVDPRTVFRFLADGDSGDDTA